MVRAVPRLGEPSMLGNSAPSRADDEGRFDVGGLAPGTYVLVAGHPDHGQTSREIELRDEPLLDVELRLELGITLEGLVTGLEFDALPQIRVAAFRAATSPSELLSVNFGLNASAALDFEGRFQLRGLRPGRWVVTARHSSDARTVQETVDIEAGVAPEPLVLRFEVEDGATLSGVVQRDGTAVAGAQVEALAPLGSGGQLRTRTDHQGRFVLRDLEAAEWRVSAQAGGASAFERVPVHGDTEIVLDLEVTHIALLVLDAATGEPLADARAVAFGEIGGVGGSQMPLTDRDGRVELAAMPGTVTVNVERSGYAQAQRRIDLLPGETRDLIVELSAGHPLVVEILRPDGAPYERHARAILYAMSEASPIAGEQRQRRGRIEIDAVPAGTWILELHAEGFAPTRVNVTTPTERPVRVRLQEGGRVRVSIPELASEQRAFVIALDPNASPAEGTSPRLMVRAGAPLVAGEAVLGPLPTGTWRLLVQIYDERALAAGGDPMRAPSTHEGLVQVVEGETVDAVMTRTSR
jgi:hypothetical protein